MFFTKKTLLSLAVAAVSIMLPLTSCHHNPDPQEDDVLANTSWKGTINEGDITVVLTFDNKGGVKEKDTFRGQSYTESGTYKLSGSLLILDVDGQLRYCAGPKFNITLNGNKLLLKQPESWGETYTFTKN